MPSTHIIKTIIRNLENANDYNAVQLCERAASLLITLQEQIATLEERVKELSKGGPKLENARKPKVRKRKKSPKYSPGTPVMERIMTMVDKDRKTGCWNWMGSGSDSYGFIRVDRRNWLVHRLMVTLTTGRQLTTKDQVMHLCDNTWCCNPNHLEVGDATSNRRDCIRKGRTGRGVSHEIAKDIRIRYLNGETARAIALLHNLPRVTVSAIAKGRIHKYLDEDPDVKAIPVIPRQNRLSTLRDDDIRAIRDLLASGMKQKEIARKYGVHPSTIRFIKTGRRWSHIS